MAQQRTESDLTWEAGAKPALPSAPMAANPADVDASEFRELARQRRFVREGEQADAPRTGSVTFGADVSTPARVVAKPVSVSSPMSDEAAAIAASLGRASDRLVVAHEQLAQATLRAERAERELAAANDRLMAANVLVQDAQRATHQTAERCAWLEGRNDALHEALELAVHASVTTRWRWRRQMAKAKREQANAAARGSSES